MSDSNSPHFSSPLGLDLRLPTRFTNVLFGIALDLTGELTGGRGVKAQGKLPEGSAEG